MTRSQAEGFIEKARTDARAGRLSLPKGRKTYLAFANAAEDYLKRLEETGGKNLKVKRRHVSSSPARRSMSTGSRFSA